jgi:predicted phage terminase large subunit-like protein
MRVNPDSEERVLQFNEEARTRLFLLFRGAFKSTIITIAHTIQLMLIWPDIRILIASHKKEGGSQKFLGSIKDHFIRNERFRALFPEYCPKANSTGQIEWGTSEMVTLPNRSKRAIYPEATIEIAGNTTDVTGRHYNYLKIDDIVTRESVTNEAMLERTEEFNALLTFLFDNPEWGISDYAGTCYHFADLYAKLRDSSQITKFILPIWDADGNPTVPERFTKLGIEQVRDHPSQTSYQFSAQYLMNPVPTDDQTFKPQWWKREGFYYEPNSLPSLLKVAIFVDPANTQKKKSDYTALCVVGLDERGHYWLMDIVRDKLDVEGRAALAIGFAEKHGLHKIHYESVGFQNTDAYIIKKLAQERQYYIQVEEMKATAASKEDRIRALQPLFERGTIHFPRRYEYYSKYHKRSLDMIESLNREAWMFPKNEHDDMIDVLSMLCRVTLYAPAKAREVKPDSLFDQMRQLAIDAKTPKHVFKGFGNRNNGAGWRIPAKKSPLG